MSKKKIAKARGRSVAEWIGKTPDSRAPPTVRLRVFDRTKGVCHISKLKIGPKDKWDVEHIRRLDDGGENRESNLAPALREAHRKKTAAETKAGRKADRVRMKHVGVQRDKRPIPQRPALDKPKASATPEKLAGLPRRGLYR
jgi:5-methylcytosine-specific restriction protein A